ncbi:hypothetical protein PVAND_002777 [Polypedilum vanderplanki]|uniref:BolA-like protein 3 n=1 Tax=Polypedilum vanderplanki TaxID=319348 RepID=A0A9J6BSE3_POLVA|nr:hypothetical protein PVAND_002777 [Polypedilum vanderplanki]
MFRQLFRNSLKLRNNLKFSTENLLTEEKLSEILKNHFKGEIKVVDISGGCGSLFEVHIKSRDFKGLSLVKQHQMVNKALKEEVKQMHGIRIFTQTE